MVKIEIYLAGCLFKLTFVGINRCSTRNRVSCSPMAAIGFRADATAVCVELANLLHFACMSYSRFLEFECEFYVTLRQTLTLFCKRHSVSSENWLREH